ncbi:hypothetical protein [Companilactobacillus alimentarius]|uniref:hypothetical protein n=1 Tax=Companilactobacillus alimentarius TaxID=1602 RepID=UPI0028B358EF|nr:hypothetical protein [Companilactobacillus alimentarius]MDT6953582.1 hypothetical protein [Companilactobacillus alimentarius]MDT6953662.1 hypothetical protein [Companilactobacillus alimentarius]
MDSSKHTTRLKIVMAKLDALRCDLWCEDIYQSTEDLNEIQDAIVRLDNHIQCS